MRQGLFRGRPLPFQPFTLNEDHLTFNVAAGSGVSNKTMAGEEIGQDLLVNLPATNRLRGTQINGGGGEGTCVLMGGSIDLRQPGADLTIRPLTIVGFKRIYVEGVLALAGKQGQDAMNIGGHTGNGVKAHFRLQMCRFDGIEGYEVGEEVHSDGIQATQITELWELARFSCFSSYQSLIGHGSAFTGVGEWDVRETNFGGWYNPASCKREVNGYPLFVFGEGDGFPSHWKDVYVDLSNSGRNPSLSSVYPPTTVDAQGFSTPDGGKTLVPNFPGSSGEIKIGRPPGGDFVKHSEVGVGYVNTVGYA